MRWLTKVTTAVKRDVLVTREDLNRVVGTVEPCAAGIARFLCAKHVGRAMPSCRWPYSGQPAGAIAGTARLGDLMLRSPLSWQCSLGRLAGRGSGGARAIF
jgi:hypothetical protein